MRDLNTVGQKSVTESKRDVNMGNPRPSCGRAQGITESKGVMSTAAWGA